MLGQFCQTSVCLFHCSVLELEGTSGLSRSMFRVGTDREISQRGYGLLQAVSS